MANKTELEELQKRLDKVEAKSRAAKQELSAQLIRQEHRTVPCLLNFWRYVLAGTEREGHRELELAAMSALFWRFASPSSAVVAGGTLVAIAGLWYAAGANRLIDSQNELIRTQNFLVESSRRSTQVFELSSILDEIDEELDELEKKGQEKAGDKDKRRVLLESLSSAATGDKSNCDCQELSERLNGRIVALSQALLPYRYQEDDGELSAPTSPEQGQLLVSLVRSNVCIPRGTNLRQALVQNTDLSYARLCWADLSNADLSAAYLSHSSMVGVSLARADLSGVRMNRAILVRAAITDANASKAEIPYADLSFSVIWNTNFESANLERSHFVGASILGVNFRGANLNDVDFTGASIWSCDFSGASLSGVKLDWTDLRKSTLETVGNLDEIASVRGANVYGLEKSSPRIFEWAITNGAMSVPDEQDWHAMREEYFVKNNVIGIEEIDISTPPTAAEEREP